MRIHLIAIGGSVMHNLAIALQKSGHKVSGSDDEIYDPARSRLEKAGLLPKTTGWNDRRISPELDAVIVGMHARKENPELGRALDLGIPVYSFPEFVGRFSKGKKRVVIAGSHGKTTTTAMIMHVLREAGLAFDYLVGAQLDGFDTMVQLSDAPVMILEGDEYLSSPLDSRPKFMHYDPDLLVITGIAWDHINVFPTFGEYCRAFSELIRQLRPGTSLIWFEGDPVLKELVQKSSSAFESIPYQALEGRIAEGKTWLTGFESSPVPLQVFGDHNLQNLSACWEVCHRLGISAERFTESIRHFGGAARRLQCLAESPDCAVFLDFAHAPSKVKATLEAARKQFSGRKLIACLELHTFSSLNPDFLPLYKGALSAADEAIVFFSEHTLKIKKLPPLSPEGLEHHFQYPGLKAFTNPEQLKAYFLEQKPEKMVIVLMSSGRFQGWDAKSFALRFCQRE